MQRTRSRLPSSICCVVSNNTMRFFSQEVYFHGSGKQPEYVLSIDSSSRFPDGRLRLVTGGADPVGRVWTFGAEENGGRLVLLSELLGHAQCINAVRFSPQSGETLASGSDDGQIIVWSYRGAGSVFGSEISSEVFTAVKKLNALDEVTGVSFSPCGGFLAASLVRDLSIVFDLGSSRHIQRLDGHNARVLGVVWDPKDEFVVSVSSDRTARIYGRAKKKKTAFYPKALISNSADPGLQALQRKLFMAEAHFSSDPTAHFFRRPDFSPDGAMLAVPGGLLPGAAGAASFAVHLFSRQNLNSCASPSASIPTLHSPAVAVKFHPCGFTADLAGTARHWVFAVVCVHYVAVYRSDLIAPVAILADVHCTSLVDATWSGYTLAVCSTDGYVSVAVFEKVELGLLLAATPAAAEVPVAVPAAAAVAVAAEVPAATQAAVPAATQAAVPASAPDAALQSAPAAALNSAPTSAPTATPTVAEAPDDKDEHLSQDEAAREPKRRRIVPELVDVPPSADIRS